MRTAPTKQWLLTAQFAGPRQVVKEFDHEFEAWAARKQLLESEPRAARPLVQLNPTHRLPLPRRAHTGDSL